MRFPLLLALLVTLTACGPQHSGGSLAGPTTTGDTLRFRTIPYPLPACLQGAGMKSLEIDVAVDDAGLFALDHFDFDVYDSPLSGCGPVYQTSQKALIQVSERMHYAVGEVGRTHFSLSLPAKMCGHRWFPVTAVRPGASPSAIIVFAVAIDYGSDC